ncbi:MAG: phosphatase PAP2 family protein [Candidatus Gracilibacteria bacterium]|nr:phosphatase PAP2 family protein [Candidatus Gracilibacteria bacterium]
MTEHLQEVNKFLLNYFNSFADNLIIQKIVFIFADAPIFFLPIFLVGYWIYYTCKNNYSEEEKINNKSSLLFIFYGVLLSMIITLVLQQIIVIDRPEEYLKNSANLLLSHVPDASFPSDHATVSFAFLTGLFLAGYKKIGYTFLPFVIVMNLSRIIAGVHWPFDILVGALVGFLGSFIIFKFCIKNKFVKNLNIWIMKLASFFKL